ncbi:MAG: DEAD/DEAH box helicase [Mariprofundales bacterium]
MDTILLANHIKNYAQLSKEDKLVLQAIAFLYAPCSRTHLVEYLRKCNIKTKKDTIINPTKIGAFLQRLLELELIVELVGTTLFFCGDKEWADYITDDALVSEKSIAYVKYRSIVKAPSRRIDNNPMLSNDEICCLFMIGAMRAAIYAYDAKRLMQEIQSFYDCYEGDEIDTEHPLLQFLPRFTPLWFSTCPTIFSVNLLLILKDMGKYVPNEKLFWFKIMAGLKDNMSAYYKKIMKNDLLSCDIVKEYIFNAEFSQAAAIVKGKQDMSAQMTLAWLAIMNGKYSQALTHYQQALSNGCDVHGKQNAYIKFLCYATLPFLPILVKYNPDKAKSIMMDIIKVINNDSEGRLNEAEQLPYPILIAYLTSTNQNQHTATWELCNKQFLEIDIQDDYGLLFIAFIMYWYGQEYINGDTIINLISAMEYWQKNEKYWLAAEAAELLYRLGNKDKSIQEYASKAREKYNFISILDMIQPVTVWEKQLAALTNMGNNNDSAQIKTIDARRLVWFLDEDNIYYITAKEQKMTKRGTWSRGRAISAKLLYYPSTTVQSYLTSQDYKITTTINEERAEHYGFHYGSIEYNFNTELAMLAMIGHPNIFWQQHPDMRIDVVDGDPRLEVTKEGEDNLRISLWPLIDEDDKECVAIRESSNRVLVISLNEQHHNIQSILGDEGIVVPETAKQQVLDAISAIAPLVMVHSDIGGGTQEAEARDADPKAHIHLFPHDEGLKVELFVQPFVDGGPLFRPSSGGVTVIAEVNGKRVMTERDLSQERKNADAVIHVCEALRNDDDADNEWVLDDPQLCLETLEALQTEDLDDKAVVSWPKGQNMHIKHKADTSSMQLHIKKERDWFQASGSLKLDADNVISMRKLLELTAASDGRFLRLEDGQFLALTKEFRKRLDDVRSYTDAKGDDVRFDGIAALALEDFTNSVGELSSDMQWKKHVKHLKSANKLKVKIPSTLQAELRSYQIEGYCWMAQLAHWGVGACLADDMGLGKTIQGLAILLHRAKDGPALVLAPTSVCANWVDEIACFAPTLTAMTFGEGVRSDMIEKAEPFDVVICSHGLLHYEAELLASKQWRTIILDEAQAIKNAATKRSQAVMRLQGDFKVITTGTPIENHLGELWNLFRFLNPGLLGSLQRFNREFAIPIERDKDRDKRNQLKKLLQPFMLRRTKQQVLTELPSKTEILLRVDMNTEEAAMYEAMRQQSVQRLSEASQNEKGHYQLKILAELMRMRRACCHPALVIPETTLGSPKLRAFSQLISELRENRHKALVFSQFVAHLHILRDHLDSQGISYQYLDGSTPTKKRKERVNAFQAGEGDVFLISLKAGGVGLNLTAADYVIHMDPWWNPAAEDQASDRSHRIGQTRPVTVYRIVVRGSIEEQIVDLHASKRDLASSLLEGSDMSGKMSPSDLLHLIREA